MKRLPKWLKIVLSTFAVLFVLGAIFGKSPTKPSPQPVAAPVGKVAASTTTSAPPPADQYTVGGVVDAQTVNVAGANGVRKTVRVLGVHAPASGSSGCYALEASSWASNLLTDKAVVLRLDPTQPALDSAGDTLAYLTLADGTDYSTVALQAGYVKYLADGVAASATAALQAAENTARTASAGLWGDPCKGNIDAPAPVTSAPAPPAAPPAPTAPAFTPPAAPDPTTEEAPAPPESDSVYYANCTAVRKAHKAPLYAGEPGYSRKLDRDGDGVACE